MLDNFGTFGFKDLFSLRVNLILAFASFFSPITQHVKTCLVFPP